MRPLKPPLKLMMSLEPMKCRRLLFCFLSHFGTVLMLLSGNPARAQIESEFFREKNIGEKQNLKGLKLFFDLQKKTQFSGKGDPASGAQAAQMGVFWRYGEDTFVSSVDLEERPWQSSRGQLSVQGSRQSALISTQMYLPYSKQQRNLGVGLGFFLGASRLVWKSEIEELWAIQQQSPWELAAGARASLWLGSSRNFGPLLILFLDSAFFQNQPKELSTNLGLGLGFTWGSLK